MGATRGIGMGADVGMEGTAVDIAGAGLPRPWVICLYDSVACGQIARISKANAPATSRLNHAGIFTGCVCERLIFCFPLERPLRNGLHW